MDIIEDTRADIIKENNTAQEEFAAILENLRPSMMELNIQTPLYGNLDLGVLGKFGNLRSIRFMPGKITEIRNIPTGIVKLECPGNMLTELDGAQLPGSLLILDITDNHLRTLDLKGASHLEELRCNNNRIEVFKNLPASLVHLYCDQNQLVRLDLQGLDRLRTLHCSQNRLLKIENLRHDIHDFKAEGSPFAMEVDMASDSEDDSDLESSIKGDKDTVDSGATERRINYIDSLDVYFRAKKEYEERLLKKRRTAYQKAPTRKMGRRAAMAIKPTCIYCNRPVGTRFYTNSKGYFAVCGDKVAPCGLNVKLVRGMFNMKEQMLYLFKEDVDKGKENVIRHKLDTLFNYYSDEAAVKKFKELMENYTITSGVYEDYLKYYEDLYFSQERKEAVHKKANKIAEILEEIRVMIRNYAENENPAALKTAIELYIHDLQPEIENLRRLKYDIVEMEENQLIEMPASLHRLEHGYLDEPKVVHFKGL